ncbi:MAG: TolC family protein [Hyphomicrobiales bacterium]
MYRYIRIISIILVLLPFTGRSQGDLKKQLSLSDAIQTGLLNNFNIGISKLNLKTAQINNTQGIAGRFPQVSLFANSNNVYDDNYSGGQESGKTDRNVLEAGLRTSWTLFSGFKVNITKKKLDALEELSEGNSEVIIENNIQSIILAYYNILLQQGKLEVLENIKKLSRDKYHFEMNRKEIGSSVTYNVLQSKDSYLADSINYLEQQLNIRKSMQNLNLLLGDQPGVQYILTDKFEADAIDFNEEELLSTVMKDNKSLRNQYVNIKLKQYETKLANSSLWPSISLNAGTSHSNSTIKVENHSSLSPNNINYYANISLSFNLFNGGRTRAAIKSARINEDITSLQTKQLEFSVKNEIFTNYDLYNIRKQLVATSMNAVETAKMNLDISLELFKNGSINSFNYRDIQLQYLNASISHLASIFNLIDTQVELLRLSGNVIGYK